MFSKRTRLSLLTIAVLACFFIAYTTYTQGTLGIVDNLPVWRFDSSSRYYVLNAEWAKTNPATADLAAGAEVLPVAEHEVKAEIAKQLRTAGGDYIKQIEQEVRAKHTEEITASLRKELQASLKESHTSFKFLQDQRSFKLQEEMKAEYLKHNAGKIKNDIINDLLRDTTDVALRKKLSEMETLGIDRGKYFQNILRQITMEYAPSGPGISNKGVSMWSNSMRELTIPIKSEKDLRERRVKLKPVDKTNLQEMHDALVTYIRELPVPPVDIWEGEGIVLSAGKNHIIGALNVIIQLRELGSELPVEVMLDSNADYHKHFCETVLPKFNAKCGVIERVLGEEFFASVNAKGFPMKVMSILVSSFDSIVYLDTDTFPIKNVDLLLSCEPFLQTHFILWPDNWHKGTSPLFYEIARLVPGELIRRDGLANDASFASYVGKNKYSEVLFHDFSGIPSFTSVESGQLVISKREHFRSLLLALYYNLNGPTYYYPLLYQGVFGSGDRETFVPALHVMNEPYYLTEWEVNFSGLEREKVHKKGEFYFDESTMVQRDPSAAMKFRRAWRRWLNEKGLDSRLNPFQNGKYTSDLRTTFFEENKDISEPAAFFLHVHSPKINTLHNELTTKARYDYKSRYIRKIGDKDDIMGTSDWDLRFQAINAWTTCEAMNDKEYWKANNLDHDELCKKMKSYVEELKKDTNEPDAANVKILSTISGLRN